jgi:hypothetical protein
MAHPSTGTSPPDAMMAPWPSCTTGYAIGLAVVDATRSLTSAVVDSGSVRVANTVPKAPGLAMYRVSGVGRVQARRIFQGCGVMSFTSCSSIEAAGMGIVYS